MQVRKSNWWVKSKQLGKLTVGLEGTSTYHLLDDADGANTRNYSDAEAAAVAQGGFLIRSGGVFRPTLADDDPALERSSARLQQRHPRPGRPPQHRALRLA